MTDALARDLGSRDPALVEAALDLLWASRRDADAPVVAPLVPSVLPTSPAIDLVDRFIEVLVSYPFQPALEGSALGARLVEVLFALSPDAPSYRIAVALRSVPRRAEAMEGAAAALEAAPMTSMDDADRLLEYLLEYDEDAGPVRRGAASWPASFPLRARLG